MCCGCNPGGVLCGIYRTPGGGAGLGRNCIGGAEGILAKDGNLVSPIIWYRSTYVYKSAFCRITWIAITSVNVVSFFFCYCFFCNCLSLSKSLSSFS